MMRTSAYGYKRKSIRPKSKSALPPGTDVPDGVAVGPVLTRSGHFAGYSSNVNPSVKLSNFDASTPARGSGARQPFLAAGLRDDIRRSHCRPHSRSPCVDAQIPRPRPRWRLRRGIQATGQGNGHQGSTHSSTVALAKRTRGTSNRIDPCAISTRSSSAMRQRL